VTTFLFKKFLNAFAILFGVVTLVFILFFVVLPADPARLTTGQRNDTKTLELIRKDLFLDKPLPIQFGLYLNDLSPVSIYKHSQEAQEKYNYTPLFGIGENKVVLKKPYLRRSYQSRKDVNTILWESFPGTLILATLSIILASIFGIALGIFAALNKGTWKDSSALFAGVLGVSMPSFLAGILMAYVFGFLLSEYTGLQIISPLWDYTPGKGAHLNLSSLILPVITLAIRPMAIIMQITRSSMMDVLNQDYIRTAYAKGLNKTQIIFKHALPNALNPIITSISGWFAELLAGSFFIEFIFGWKGLGKITVDALNKFDFPVLMGSILFTSCIFILVNIFVDVLYKWIDPRIK
jgi:peptide/nickel transport system permease protein